MNKNIVIVIVIVIIALGFWFFSGGYTPSKPIAGSNIIFFGDSLVQGVGASEGKSMPSLLAEKIGMPVINAGVSGDTTEMALVRIEKDVLSKDPKLVIIVLGGNDFLRRVSKEQTLINIKNIITQVQAKGGSVVLAGFNASIFGSYNSDYKKIAKETKSGFVDNIFSGILNSRELMSDAIHPNDKGYEKMVEKFVPVVKEILK